jgi:alkanesulfonate monooxygenase SsuD/methylene tetrahydromethanopterin reductase-like flavin-dependent oxidoreductase (luciferase family)
MRVGLCIPVGERGPELIPFRYREMRELAQAAESGGLDSIWMADHLFIQGGETGERGLWESMSMLAALADATTRVELGPLVLCTPFRNPGMIAWAANALDEISDGRFVLGMGAGWHQPEFDAFGFNFDHKVSEFADALEITVPLLRDGQVSYAGKYHKGEARLHPRGPRPQGPPILLAGSGPRMLGLIAKFADRWNSVWYGLPTEEFRDERRRLEQACAQIGRDPKTIEVSAGIQIYDPATVNENGPEKIVGRAPQILDALRIWQAEGVTEVMCRMEPASVALAGEISRAAQELRAG